MFDSRLRRLALAAAVALSAGTSWSPTHAQESTTTSTAQNPPKFTITPTDGSAFFTITARPGESRSLQVRLRNAGTEAGTARTYVADAFTTVNGGLAAKDFGEERTGTSTWLTYPDESLDLAPGADTVRTARLAVPQDAAPGEHLSTLVIENAELFAGGGAVQAQQRLRQVIAVLIKVPGPTNAEFSIGRGRHNVVGTRSVVIISLTNSGNVLVKPTGPVVIKDAQGQSVAETTVAMGSLYAGDSAELEVTLASALLPGDYVGTWDLTDKASGASAKEDVAFSVSEAEAATAKTAKEQLLPTVNQSTTTPASVDQSDSSDRSLLPFYVVGGLVVILILVVLVVRR